MKGRRMPVDWRDHNHDDSVLNLTTKQRKNRKSSLSKSSSTVRCYQRRQQKQKQPKKIMTNRTNMISLILIFTLWATLCSSKTSSDAGIFMVDAAGILLTSKFPFKWRRNHNVTSNNDKSNHILSLQRTQQQQQQNRDPQKSQELVSSPMKQLQRTNEIHNTDINTQNKQSRARHHSLWGRMKQKSTAFFRHQRQKQEEPTTTPSGTASAVNSVFSTKTAYQNYVPGSSSNSYSPSTMTTSTSRGSIIVSGSFRTAPNSSTALSATLTSDNGVAQEEDESSSSSSSSPSSESVHLRLGSEAMTPEQDNNSDDDTTATDTNSDNELSSSSQDKKNKQSFYILHTYRDPRNPVDIQYKGFNMCKRKFASWVNHTLAQEEDDHDETSSTSFSSSDTTIQNQNFDASYISSEQINIEDESIRNELRTLWKQRRLLSERTEVLATYQSDKHQVDKSTTADSSNHNAKDELDTASKSKRGGFSDLLQLYAERLAAIIQDELEEEMIAATGNEAREALDQGYKDNPSSAKTQNKVPPPKHMIKVLNNGGLLGWLEREYGQHGTQKLCSLSTAASLTTTATTTSSTSQDQMKEHFEILQNFMDWFRERFPYYYDRCGSCGASAKDDDHLSSSKDDDDDDDDQEKEEEEEEVGKGNDIHNVKDQEQDIDVEDDNGTFLGYVYPNAHELLGKASRTEMYQCHKCNAFTRFPRYNAASVVIHNERGRCGEYSMLLYRLLRACGLQSRWVVDWADHVWAEVLLDGKWIHLDPCEAAVDQPLLYESWGKQQTYIIAFHDGDNQQVHSASSSMVDIPLIEDVTQRYTSESIENIDKRRSSDINLEDTKVTVERVTQNLTLLLKQLKDK